MPSSELSSSSSPPRVGGLCSGVLLPGLELPFSRAVLPVHPGRSRPEPPLVSGASWPGRTPLTRLSFVLGERCLQPAAIPGEARGVQLPRAAALDELLSPGLRRRLCLARGQARWPRARESLCARCVKAPLEPWRGLARLKAHQMLARASQAAGRRLVGAQDPAPCAPRGSSEKAKCDVLISARSLLLRSASSSWGLDTNSSFSH